MSDSRLGGGFLAALLLTVGCAMQPAPSIAQAAKPEAESLRAEALRNGSVRVVVTLAIVGQNPPAADVIRVAQDRLLAALATTHYENLHRFQNLPQLAMTVRRDALEALLASPLVAAVAPDALAGSMAPGLSR